MMHIRQLIGRLDIWDTYACKFYLNASHIPLPLMTTSDATGEDQVGIMAAFIFINCAPPAGRFPNNV